MLKNKKKLLMSLSIILSAFLVSGCNEPDAYLCTVIISNPLELSEVYCKNLKTKEKKSYSISEINKFIATDPDSYESLRKYYKEQCN